MPWYKDNNGHILESKAQTHRLQYCPLCQKLIAKQDCIKLRQAKSGDLYEIKRYHYDRQEQQERQKKKRDKHSKKNECISLSELTRIVRQLV
jgi:hypothetical protein